MTGPESQHEPHVDPQTVPLFPLPAGATDEERAGAFGVTVDQLQAFEGSSRPPTVQVAVPPAVEWLRSLLREGQVWEARHRAAYWFMREWIEAEKGTADGRRLSMELWVGGGRYGFQDIWGARDAVKAATAIHENASFLLRDLGREWR